MPHFTKEWLLEIQPSDTEFRVSDEVQRVGKNMVGVTGLTLRVFPSGIKTFGFQDRTRAGRKVWIKIGRFGDITLEQARDIAANLKHEIALGSDPAKSRRDDRNAKTVNDLADKFMEEHIKVMCRNSTISDTKRYLDLFIRPKLGTMPISEVGSGTIADLLQKIRKNTPYQANRIRSVLSKMFNMAELWELRPGGSNPAVGQIRAPESKRERRLNDNEIRALGQVLAKIDALPRGAFDEAGELRGETPYGKAAIRLALLTGMRKGEILGLQWDWVDLEAGLIRIPPAMHKTGKKIGTRIVYLCQPAIALLRDLPHGMMPKVKGKSEEESSWVICGDAGKPLVQSQDVWERIRESVTAASLKEARKAGKKKGEINISDVTFHDLRRTFAGIGTDLLYPELILGALLGHAAGTITQGYARAGNRILAEAAETIGGRMWELLNEEAPR